MAVDLLYSQGTRRAGPMQSSHIAIGSAANGAACTVAACVIPGTSDSNPHASAFTITSSNNFETAGAAVGDLVEGTHIKPNTYVLTVSTTTLTVTRLPNNTTNANITGQTLTFFKTPGAGATVAFPTRSGFNLLAGSNLTITESATTGSGTPTYTLASTASGTGDVAAGSTFTTANVLMVCDGDDKTIDEPSGTITTNSQALTVGGALAATTGTFSGILKTDNTTAATSITDGSLQTDGGLSVTFDAVIGDDIILISDGAVIHFGVDKDTTLTHTDGSGLTLNSTNKLMFGDADSYIHQSADTVLDLVSDGEIELTAPTVDINASTEVNVDTPSFIVHSSTSDKPDVLISNTNDDATGPSLEFSLETSNNAAANDVAGTIHFKADDSANAQTEYGRIQVKANAVTNGSESGKMFFGVHTTGGGSTGAYADVMTITGGANAAGSTVEIAGNLTVTGDTIYHSETVQVVEDNSLAFRAGDGNDHEVILTAADASADRTITMPDLGGHMAIMAVAVTETITATPAELNLLDTAAADTVRNSKAVIYGSGGEIAASALTVDSIEVDGKVITMTGDTDDTVVMTAAANGEFTIATTDDAAAAGHMNLDADGKIVLNVADDEHVVFETAGTSMFNIGVATAAKGTGATAIGEADGATAIDAFDCSVYQATKYFIIVEDTTNNDLMTTEILLLGDDNPSTAEAFMTVYAVVFNNVELGTFTATTSGDTITLNFVPASVANTGSFKVRAVTQRISAI